MEQYIGLDVSLKVTHICVVDGEGKVLARGREATQPELPAKAIADLAPAARGLSWRPAASRAGRNGNCRRAAFRGHGVSPGICSGGRPETPGRRRTPY